MMEYRLGDTIMVHKTTPLKPLTPEEMDDQLREVLIAFATGEVPQCFHEDKEAVTLTTQEMVDEYNAKEGC